MQLQAKARLKAKLDGRETQTLDLKIEATPEAMKTIVNLLAAIQYNTGVGHSCTIGAFFDGDGADKVWVEGLPDNLGKEMASACSSHGDGVLAMIGPDTALTYNAQYEERDGQTIEILRKKSVYPEVIEHRLRGGF
jgi:hypothetical protein